MLHVSKIPRIKEYLRHTNERVVFCACSLFLISVLFPFLTISSGSGIGGDINRITYWSCKTTVDSLRLGAVETRWFASYWFAQYELYSSPPPNTLGFSWVLVTMLSMQIFTLSSGFATLFLHRKFKKLLSLISCLSVVFLIFLMAYVVFRAENNMYIFYETYELRYWFRFETYELGYWLCYPSAILFLLVFLLNLRTSSNS
jgi:hypothetical protein